jgi:ribosomal protein L40E
MKILAQTIDSRHWERKEEIARDLARTSSSSKPSGPSKSGSANPSSDNKKSAPNKSSTSSSPSTPKRPDLSDKLGKDGKLTPAERKRRFDNKLCMFCGFSGHMAKDCRKSGSSASKARAANVSETSTSTSAHITTVSEK